jgi:cardiolipin synthase
MIWSMQTMQAGINIAPGAEDDGWTTPPSVTLDDGTTVQLFKDGEALQAAYQAIEAARHRICLEVYIFASDKTGSAFAELLSRKASEGVRVHVSYDSFGSIGSDKQMFEQMRRAGVNLVEFNPIAPWRCKFSWRPANRDHRKMLVIDNDIAGLGGLNIGREYSGSWVIRERGANECDFWRDNAVGIVGPGARYLLRSFSKTWHYSTHGGRIRGAEFNYNTHDLGKPHNGRDLGILASVPSRSSPLRSLLRTIFHSATRSIQMTMAYFAPDDDLVNELIHAARRGVRVQLMLPARCDVGALMIAARSYYERLLTAGVEVYERQTVVLHAKTMTIDGRLSVIGSTNLDYRSIEYNLELSAIIRSEKFGAQMSDLFDNDVKFAKQIKLKEWRRRPTSDRIVQWAVSRARYLL